VFESKQFFKEIQKNKISTLFKALSKNLIDTFLKDFSHPKNP